MLCYAMLCCAVLCCAVLCCDVLCCAVLCRVVSCRVVSCRVVLCCVVLCCVMLCSVVFCCVHHEHHHHEHHARLKVLCMRIVKRKAPSCIRQAQCSLISLYSYQGQRVAWLRPAREGHGFVAGRHRGITRTTAHVVAPSAAAAETGTRLFRCRILGTSRLKS